MADENSFPSVYPSLAAEIVGSYAAKNLIAIAQIGEVITTVHQTLSGLTTSTPAPTAAADRLFFGGLLPSRARLRFAGHRRS